MRTLLTCLMLFACRSDPPCYDNHYSDVVSFSTQPNTKTPSGIQVDTSGFSVDLAAIDTKVLNVENCLKAKYPNGVLPPDVVVNGQCIRNTFDTTIHRDCMRVKIASDWHVGCSGEQVFPCNVPIKLCEDKGIMIDPHCKQGQAPSPDCPCPCECRSAIEQNDTVITTPDLRLFDDALMRLTTGCNFIWVAGLVECYE